MQRLAGSNKIASLVRDILSRRRGHDRSTCRSFPLRGFACGGSAARRKLTPSQPWARSRSSQAGANPLPDFGSVVLLDHDQDGR